MESEPRFTLLIHKTIIIQNSPYSRVLIFVEVKVRHMLNEKLEKVYNKNILFVVSNRNMNSGLDVNQQYSRYWRVTCLLFFTVVLINT